MAQRENDEYDPGVEEENSQPHHHYPLHHRAQNMLNQQQTQTIHLDVQNPRDVESSDDDEDEDFEFPNAAPPQLIMQQQQHLQHQQLLQQQQRRAFDPTQLTPQQLLELQRQKEEEDEARKYYEPIDFEKEGLYHVKDLAENTQKYRWRIDNVSQIRQKLYSPEFTVGGYKWRVLIFPHGNNVQYVSMYLDVADAKNLGNDWCRYARFQLSILNQKDIAKSHGQDAEKRFNPQESDWGFREFLPLLKFKSPEAGFLVNDTCFVEAVVHVSDDPYLLNPRNYDSKKETGFVGLRNQGATCYLNSLLQTLFHISYFRKAVYQMPIGKDEKPENSVPFALQRVFLRLQEESGPVDTKELTKSFGWDTIDSFLQHDIQELARVLVDNLEKKMENTPSKDTMKYLFEGTSKNYFKCIHVDYESSHKDTWYDLQLNVKGCKDVYQSFEQYNEVEMLEGENQYRAEGYGLQDAKKGSIFLSFPPVLMLHLKRFEYDIQRDIMYKINDRYEFPLEMDLTRFLDPECKDYHEDNTYCLFSVLVHSGDVSGGHYYAFIRPYPGEEPDQWYKFDDEKVYKVRKQDAADENFGGEERKTKYFWLQGHVNSIYKKFTNAYMLVYIRKSKIGEILKKIGPEDVPEHLKISFEKERELQERKRREKDEASKYCNIKIVTDNDLANHCGLDLVNFDMIEPMKVRKDATLTDVKEIFYKKYGIPPERQRFWRWEKRQNKTVRPDTPIEVSREHIAIEKLYPVYSSELYLYLEVSKAKENAPPFEPITRDDVHLFFKFYQPEAKRLAYCGSFMFKQKQKMSEIMPQIKRTVALDENTPVDVFEEVRSIMIEPVQINSNLKAAELQHGDIIVFQRSLNREELALYQYPTVQSYYAYLNHRVDVQICRLEEPDTVVHTVELLKTMSYQDVVTELAKYLNTEPQFIRLTGHNPYGNHHVRPAPFKTTEVKSLKEMIVVDHTTPFRLYYEILDLPITEVENKREVYVSYFNDKVEEVERIKLLMPKESTFNDLIHVLKEKLGNKIEHPEAPMRVMAIHNHKISKFFQPDDLLDRYSAYNPELRAECITEEEIAFMTDPAFNSTHRIIQVQHVCKDNMNIRSFGHPFILCVSMEETVGNVKERIKNKLQIKDEEFKKYKLAALGGVHQYGYLTDDNAPFIASFEKGTLQGIETYLGLEHKDPSPRIHSRLA